LGYWKQARPGRTSVVRNWGSSRLRQPGKFKEKIVPTSKEDRGKLFPLPEREPERGKGSAWIEETANGAWMGGGARVYRQLRVRRTSGKRGGG